VAAAGEQRWRRQDGRQGARDIDEGDTHPRKPRVDPGEGRQEQHGDQPLVSQVQKLPAELLRGKLCGHGGGPEVSDLDAGGGAAIGAMKNLGDGPHPSAWREQLHPPKEGGQAKLRFAAQGLELVRQGLVGPGEPLFGLVQNGGW